MSISVYPQKKLLGIIIILYLVIQTGGLAQDESFYEISKNYVSGFAGFFPGGEPEQPDPSKVVIYLKNPQLSGKEYTLSELRSNNISSLAVGYSSISEPVSKLIEYLDFEERALNGDQGGLEMPPFLRGVDGKRLTINEIEDKISYRFVDYDFIELKEWKQIFIDLMLNEHRDSMMSVDIADEENKIRLGANLNVEMEAFKTEMRAFAEKMGVPPEALIFVQHGPLMLVGSSTLPNPDPEEPIPIETVLERHKIP